MTEHIWWNGSGRLLDDGRAIRREGWRRPNRQLRVGWLVEPDSGPSTWRSPDRERAAAESLKGAGVHVDGTRVPALERHFALGWFDKRHGIATKPPFREARTENGKNPLCRQRSIWCRCPLFRWRPISRPSARPANSSWSDRRDNSDGSGRVTPFGRAGRGSVMCRAVIGSACPSGLAGVEHATGSVFRQCFAVDRASPRRIPCEKAGHREGCRKPGAR